MKTDEHPGVYVDSITPLAPLPEQASGAIIFRVNVRFVLFEQKVHFDVEVPAHGFDEAAQVVYLRLASLFTDASQIAKQASDALLSKLPKTT